MLEAVIFTAATQNAEERQTQTAWWWFRFRKQTVTRHNEPVIWAEESETDNIKS